MSDQTARDPYVVLNEHFRRQAQAEIPAYYRIGTVLSTAPLRVRAGGMDLDREDLLVAQHLIAGWRESLTGLAWPVESELLEKRLQGGCEITIGTTTYTGKAWADRPAETVKGKTADQADVVHIAPLAAGDRVLLTPSADGQTYYLVDKLVGVEA